MPVYAVYNLDELGGIIQRLDIIMENDQSAIEYARMFLESNETAEVWEGTRRLRQPTDDFETESEPTRRMARS